MYYKVDSFSLRQPSGWQEDRELERQIQNYADNGWKIISVSIRGEGHATVVLEREHK